jgi:hypothetical protein
MSPMPIPQEELFDRLRRSFARYEFRVGAEVIWHKQRLQGQVRNISRGGAFIELEQPLPMNVSFCAFLALDTPLQLNCKVRRVVPGRGIGVTISVPASVRPRFDGLILALASVGRSDQPRAVAKQAAASQAQGRPGGL